MANYRKEKSLHRVVPSNRGKISADDNMLVSIEEILQAEPDSPRIVLTSPVRALIRH